MVFSNSPVSDDDDLSVTALSTMSSALSTPTTTPSNSRDSSFSTPSKPQQQPQQPRLDYKVGILIYTKICQQISTHTPGSFYCPDHEVVCNAGKHPDNMSYICKHCSPTDCDSFRRRRSSAQQLSELGSLRRSSSSPPSSLGLQQEASSSPSSLVSGKYNKMKSSTAKNDNGNESVEHAPAFSKRFAPRRNYHHPPFRRTRSSERNLQMSDTEAFCDQVLRSKIASSSFSCSKFSSSTSLSSYASASSCSSSSTSSSSSSSSSYFPTSTIILSSKPVYYTHGTKKFSEPIKRSPSFRKQYLQRGRFINSEYFQADINYDSDSELEDFENGHSHNHHGSNNAYESVKFSQRSCSSSFSSSYSSSQSCYYSSYSSCGEESSKKPQIKSCLKKSSKKKQKRISLAFNGNSSSCAQQQQNGGLKSPQQAALTTSVDEFQDENSEASLSPQLTVVPSAGTSTTRTVKTPTSALTSALKLENKSEPKSDLVFKSDCVSKTESENGSMSPEYQNNHYTHNQPHPLSLAALNRHRNSLLNCSVGTASAASQCRQQKPQVMSSSSSASSATSTCLYMKRDCYVVDDMDCSKSGSYSLPSSEKQASYSQQQQRPFSYQPLTVDTKPAYTSSTTFCSTSPQKSRSFNNAYTTTTTAPTTSLNSLTRHKSFSDKVKTFGSIFQMKKKKAVMV